jgi:hypothetical protein
MEKTQNSKPLALHLPVCQPKSASLAKWANKGLESSTRSVTMDLNETVA